MKPSSLLLLLPVLCLMCLLIPSPISAFAIAPGKTVTDFTPNTVALHDILLINTERQSLTLALEATGELAPYIQLSQTRVTLAPDTSLVIPYTLQLPANFPRSGSITGMIIAHQDVSTPSGGLVNSVRIGALVGVGSVVQVNVPYHGRSLLATVAIPPVDPYIPVEFVAQAKNVGDETLGNVRVAVAVYDLDEQLIAEVSSEERSLRANERANFIATWDANVSYGEYHAVITFMYDGREQEVLADFTVGSFAVELLDLRVEDFVFGSQARLLAVLQNQEAREVTVASDITLQDAQAHYAVSLGQQSLTLGPQQDTVLSSTWDLAQVPTGSYTGKVSLTADGITVHRRFFVELTPTGISASLAPFNALTGQVISLEPTSDIAAPLRQPLVFFVVLLLIAINIGIFIVLRLRRQRQSRQQPPSMEELP